jgi:hypothetical protein
MWRVWLAAGLLVVELYWLWREAHPALWIGIPVTIGLTFVNLRVGFDLRHQARCACCRAARAAVQVVHPDWLVWTVQTHSHRASESAREVIAVFYQEPKVISEPPRYVLVAVPHNGDRCEVLPDTPHSPYRLLGQK